MIFKVLALWLLAGWTLALGLDLFVFRRADRDEAQR
jgi:hypothetical protein